MTARGVPVFFLISRRIIIVMVIGAGHEEGLGPIPRAALPKGWPPILRALPKQR